MNAESLRLRQARGRLAKAERAFCTPEAQTELREGLALLEDIAATGPSNERAIADNLVHTYSARLVASVGALVTRDAALPEPELERLFKLLLIFDEFDFPASPAASQLKVTIARRLIDRYLEGHPPAAKEQAVAELMKIASRS